MRGLSGLAIGMSETHTLFMSINWRASLVPAAAVIPASIVYIKVAVVKKLVVEFLPMQTGPPFGRASGLPGAFFRRNAAALDCVVRCPRHLL